MRKNSDSIEERLQNFNVKPRCRWAFTLLEVLICLAIVAMMSVLFGIQGKELLDQYRLESSIDLIHAEMQKAKFLSLAYRSDVELILVKKKKDFHLLLKSDEPGLSKYKSMVLPAVAEVRIEKKNCKEQKLVKYSSGRLIECALCEIHGKKSIWKIDDKARIAKVEQKDV